MKIKAYTTLGWMAWQGIQVVTRRKLGQHKLKLGIGAAAVLGIVAAGAVAARATSDDG